MSPAETAIREALQQVRTIDPHCDEPEPAKMTLVGANHDDDVWNGDRADLFLTGAASGGQGCAKIPTPARPAGRRRSAANRGAPRRWTATRALGGRRSRTPGAMTC
jgi:hypothetical protein